MQADKPGSVSRVFGTLIIYLALTLLSGSNDLPTDLGRVALTAQVCTDTSLFGLSTRKVYPATLVSQSAVSSYLTFSPLP